MGAFFLKKETTMTIRTKRLKNGSWLVKASQGKFSTSCTNKNKKQAFTHAVAGVIGMLGYNQ